MAPRTRASTISSQASDPPEGRETRSRSRGAVGKSRTGSRPPLTTILESKALREELVNLVTPNPDKMNVDPASPAEQPFDPEDAGQEDGHVKVTRSIDYKAKYEAAYRECERLRDELRRSVTPAIPDLSNDGSQFDLKGDLAPGRMLAVRMKVETGISPEGETVNLRKYTTCVQLAENHRLICKSWGKLSREQRKEIEDNRLPGLRLSGDNSGVSANDIEALFASGKYGSGELFGVELMGGRKTLMWKSQVWALLGVEGFKDAMKLLRERTAGKGPREPARAPARPGSRVRSPTTERQRAVEDVSGVDSDSDGSIFVPLGTPTRSSRRSSRRETHNDPEGETTKGRNKSVAREGPRQAATPPDSPRSESPSGRRRRSLFGSK